MNTITSRCKAFEVTRVRNVELTHRGDILTLARRFNHKNKLINVQTYDSKTGEKVGSMTYNGDGDMEGNAWYRKEGNTKVVTQYIGDRLISVTRMIDNLLSGMCSYYRDGELFREAEYNNGLLNGEERYFNALGQHHVTINYDDGIMVSAEKL